MSNQPVALVTGANRGIGFEVCRQLAAKGYTVIVAARDLAKATAAAAKIGAQPVALDVTQDESVRTAAKWVESQFGKLDVLVNNAGGNFDMTNQASTVAMDYMRDTLEMNLIGAWRVTQAMLPLLRKSSHARIVNVSSGAGAFAGEGGFGLALMGGGAPAYGVSKAALTALTVKLAAELRGQMLVNAVCPGWTATYPGGAEQGARPVGDGAASVVWAATLPADGPTGGFFRDGQRLAW